ncbi:calcium homeostasis modulator protein 6-like [Triplophysa rosa]|uniref:calcium homeostasis modulator protein 6-like n=1 Tax=Triplophysa rosa TaxID=992332 RepID=UPI002545C841|nr:calcium homeostasis modulator protein 6-like [Triplophysa rosa]XP_057182110.1 calcium homeostasis modulator protein 6-like [Triplophysa rosa]
MPSPHDLLKSLHDVLSKSIFFSSVPMSLLLIGLEGLIEPNLSCPCSEGWNKPLIALIFIGPFLFTFALMFILLRPCTCEHRCSVDPKALLKCLFPPVMWIIILLLDGDYVACASTTWKGNYASSIQSIRKWCVPSNLSLTEKVSDFQFKYQTFIATSQIAGYGGIIVISLIIICVGATYCYEKTYTETQGGAEDGAEDGAQGGASNGMQGGAKVEALWEYFLDKSMI